MAQPEFIRPLSESETRGPVKIADLDESSREQELQQHLKERFRMVEPTGIMAAMKDFNVGLSQSLGLPRAGADMLRVLADYEEGSALPSGETIQNYLAEIGGTYPAGEEPDEFVNRIYQNLGAAAPMILTALAKAPQYAHKAWPYITELMSSTGGAAGGKLLENTEWGRRNPVMARALGEIGGGITPAAGTGVPKLAWKMSPVGAAYRTTTKPFKGVSAKKRAARRISNAAQDLDAARSRAAQTEGYGEYDPLTPTQKTGDRGIAQFRRGVEGEYPGELEAGVRQRSQANQALEDMARKGQGDVAAARQYLDRRLSQLANEAQESLSNIKNVDDPEVYNVRAKKTIDNAYSVSRMNEGKVWRNLPKDKLVTPSKTSDVYIEELSDITEGGDIEEISKFLRQKLGVSSPKTGKLVGGELIHGKKKTASAKAMHQFYSVLGRKIRELSDQSGNTNRIRILNRVREAVLKDLDDSLVGPEYRKAIDFSKDLNEKFTRGDLGRVLGFGRGQASYESMVLDDLLADTGQKGKENLQQLLRASPETADDVKNFIRTRFASATMDPQTQRVNTQSGKVFLKKYKKILDNFPGLKNEIQNAVINQRHVDDFMGSRDISGMSPLAREKAAAGVFLGADPGDEVSVFLKYGAGKGQTSKLMKDLVKEVKKDETGKALNGLKDAFIDELLESSKKTGEKGLDPLTEKPFVSGKIMLSKMNRLEKPLVESRLMSSKEIKRLRRIGDAFRRLEVEIDTSAKQKVITDVPGRLLDFFAGGIGAVLGGRSAPGTPGGSIRMAGIGSKFVRDLANSITKDEARDLLIQSTKDDEIWNMMMKDITDLEDFQMQNLIKKIKLKISQLAGRAKNRISQMHAPAAAVTPPLVTVGQGAEQEAEERWRMR